MRTIFLLCILLLSVVTLDAKDYTKNQKVRYFIHQLVVKNHFDRAKLTELFRHVKYQKKALAVYVPSLRPKVKPHKKRKKIGSWDHYTKMILKPSKIPLGVEYLREHRSTLHRAYRQYGVPPEYIVALIGIESHYGKHAGRYPVFDTLTTLAFERNRRNRFFRSELKAFLLMTKQEGINPKNVKGSYAGAIGQGQFMPSNYKIFAVDFDHDGKTRMTQANDAIGSVAHYLKRHGWKKNQKVAVRVSYSGTRYNARKTGYRYKYSRASLKGIEPKEPLNYNGKVHLIKLKKTDYDELWYGTHNFHVITRYNHSSYYAMAVHQLAQNIKEKYREKYGQNP